MFAYTPCQKLLWYNPCTVDPAGGRLPPNERNTTGTRIHYPSARPVAVPYSRGLFPIDVLRQCPDPLSREFGPHSQHRRTSWRPAQRRISLSRDDPHGGDAMSTPTPWFA